jgi:predicted RNase H-like HicB family nuclease
MRAVVLHPGEDGYWVTECPSLPGCVSQGKTKAEAIANIREAIEGWIETAKAHDRPIPEEDFDTQVVCV